MACIERRIQQFFAPMPPVWSAPVPMDALDAAVLRRLRYIAVCPVGVAAWFVAAFAMGGPSAPRVGTLLGAVVQATIMLTARAPSPRLPTNTSVLTSPLASIERSDAQPGGRHAAGALLHALPHVHPQRAAGDDVDDGGVV